jgi:phosphohistidine phosphatase
MDRLILLRHAKAESDAPSGDDFDRALAPRGLREAAAMAGRLAALGLRPDLALVSPAMRTRQTWEAVEATVPGAEVRLDRSLYNADAAALRRMVREAAEGAGTVLVVGHNPGLQELAVRLLVEAGGPAGFLGKAQRAFPPAAAAVFRFDAHGRPSAEELIYPEREA